MMQEEKEISNARAITVASRYICENSDNSNYGGPDMLVQYLSYLECFSFFFKQKTHNIVPILFVKTAVNVHFLK